MELSVLTICILLISGFLAGGGVPLTASGKYPEITQAFEEICKRWQELLEGKSHGSDKAHAQES